MIDSAACAREVGTILPETTGRQTSAACCGPTRPRGAHPSSCGTHYKRHDAAECPTLSDWSWRLPAACFVRFAASRRTHTSRHGRRGWTRGPATPSTARALCGSAARGGGLDVESVYVSDSAYRSLNVCIPCQLNDIGGLSGRNSFTTEFTRAPRHAGARRRGRAVQLSALPLHRTAPAPTMSQLCSSPILSLMVAAIAAACPAATLLATCARCCASA